MATTTEKRFGWQSRCCRKHLGRTDTPEPNTTDLDVVCPTCYAPVYDSVLGKWNVGLDYESACIAATTAQGLDEVVDFLKANGEEVVVEQTGGFCMVATIYLTPDHRKYIGITNEGEWIVSLYEEDEDGEIDAGDGECCFVETLDDVLRVVRRMKETN